MNRHTPGLRALIVDDESLARDALLSLLEEDPDIVQVEEAANVDQAARKIQAAQPDLIFLDVQMPGGNGFSLLERVNSKSAPAIIFVTAFEQHAVAAFDGDAVDYLLKPVTRERFGRALERAKARVVRPPLPPTTPPSSEWSGAQEKVQPPYLPRIVVQSGGGIELIKVRDVEWFEAYENYIRIHTEKKHYLLHATLNRLVARLNPEIFVRVHRSAVVNIESIREVRVHAPGEYVLTLVSGTCIHTGRSYRQTLRALLSNYI